METISARFVAITAVAPLAWGTTYLVTEEFLPPDRPLFAALMRALPAGLILLALRREFPQGDWWWKALLLGICNIGLFFPLIFLAAYQLPGGLAATVQATSPLAVMAIAWLVIAERASGTRVVAALVGLLGVSMLVLQSPDGVTGLGLAAAAGSVLVSGLGFVLVKRWKAPVPMLTLVSWQLVAGGLFLLPVAFLVEGAPPHIDVQAAGGLPLDRRRRHDPRLHLLVHRAQPDARGRGLAGRPAQPDGGHRARHPVRRRGVRLAAGRRHGAGAGRGDRWPAAPYGADRRPIS